MQILISGSLAYDYIMDFPDSFRNHILPDAMHMLNVCFVVDKLNKNFGGTAGNIAYTMKLLGADPLILSAVGKDADTYLSHLRAHDIPTENIRVVPETFTASAHITTDKDDNQITAFYNGASAEALSLSVHEIRGDVSSAIIAPTKKEVMIKHAKECYEKKIPFCFDPGQQATAFTAQELMMLIGQSAYLIGNDYELRLLQKKTGWDTTELLNHTETIITTLGNRGSVIHTKERAILIAPCPPGSVDDPTGAGDAYRAGFFVGVSRGVDLETCGRLASVSASYAIERYGTQNHSFTIPEFQDRYEKTYGRAIELRM